MIGLFRSLPKIHDHKWDWDKNCFENWEFCVFRQFSFHDNRIVQSSHFCSSLANSSIQFFVLLSIARKCNPKMLELLLLFQCRSVHLQHAVDQRFSKDEVRQFWLCLFSFRRRRMSHKIYYDFLAITLYNFSNKEKEMNWQTMIFVWLFSFSTNQKNSTVLRAEGRAFSMTCRLWSQGQELENVFSRSRTSSGTLPLVIPVLT